MGKAVGAPDLRVDVCELDLARAIAAASGESDSRLKFMVEPLEVTDCRFRAAICDCK